MTNSYIFCCHESLLCHRTLHCRLSGVWCWWSVGDVGVSWLLSESYIFGCLNGRRQPTTNTTRNRSSSVGISSAHTLVYREEGWRRGDVQIFPATNRWEKLDDDDGR